ncbi:MAG: hypothetical protein AAGA30_02080 [Planctomycetota bacterium]
MAVFLETDSTRPQHICKLLTDRCESKPLLIVLDNSNCIGDLSFVEFLVQAAGSSTSLKAIRLATDDVDFLTKLRTKIQSCEKLPGFTILEAEALFEQSIGSLSDLQKRAIEILVGQYDGHIGLLRICVPRIASLKSEEEFKKFVSELVVSKGDAEQFYSALFNRFKDSLSDSAFELCRRLTIAIRPFRKTLGNFLSRAKEEFSFEDAWNFCAAGVFDKQESARFSLPDLYVSGLVDYSNESERIEWHELAADTLQSPVKGVVDGLDFYYGVIHRFLAGNLDEAVSDATTMLAMAASEGKHQNLQFLQIELDRLLGDSVEKCNNLKSKVLWFLFQVRFSLLLDETAVAAEKSDRLANLLVEAKDALSISEQDIELLSLGWVTVLENDSELGKSTHVFKAMDHFALHQDRIASEIRVAAIYLAFLASAKSDNDPLPLISLVAGQFAQSSEIVNQELWFADNGYAFWRLTGYAIYNYATTIESIAISDFLQELNDPIVRFEQANETNVAAILRATQVRIVIDVQDDRKNAVALSTDLLNLKGVTDLAVEAHVFQTSGDALRCNSQFDVAINAYKSAIKTCPIEEVFDRSQTHMSLSFSYARSGNIENGIKHLRLARQIADETTLMNMRQMKIHADLELAALFLHKKEFEKCLESLENAKQLIDGSEKQVPECIPLAQLAIRVVSFSSGSSEFELPVPGFTIGISENMPGFGEIAPNATEFMLGYAHLAIGNYAEALKWLDQSTKTKSSSDQMAHMFASRCELKLNNLVSACKHFVLAHGDEKEGSETMVLPVGEILVEEILTFAIKEFTSTDDLPQLEEVIELLEGCCEVPLVSLFSNALNALLNALSQKGDEAIAKTYEEAMSSGFHRISRQLAWIWCYRFISQDRKLYESEATLWFWRLCWLSQLIGSDDLEYLKSTADQINSYWSRFTENDDFKLVRLVRNVLEVEDNSSLQLRNLATVFGKRTITTIGLRHFVEELQRFVPCFPNDNFSEALIPSFVTRFFDAILNNSVQESQPDFRKLVVRLQQTLHDCNGYAIDKWNSATDDLFALWTIFEQQHSYESAYRALLKWKAVTEDLQPISRAQYFIVLRHFFTPIDNPRETLEEVFRSLASVEVAELLDSEELTEVLKVRLATVHTAGKAHVAKDIYYRALTALSIQSNVGVPVAREAVEDAKGNLNSSIEQIENCIRELDELDSQVRSSENLQNELWSICFDRGGLRKMTAAAFRLRDKDDVIFDQWLSQAFEDFRKAAAATDEKLCQLKALIEQLTIAKYYQRDAEIAELASKIEQLKPDVTPQQFEFLLGQTESDILLQERSEGEPPRGWLKTEEQIQFFADQIMESIGLPPERRENVVDDFRKMAHYEKVQDEFCQYLQPMQNLEHNQSPYTAYASKTRYTCDCTLLNLRTHIETDDIETCIAAMQRAHCDECEHRKPRNS